MNIKVANQPESVARIWNFETEVSVDWEETKLISTSAEARINEVTQVDLSSILDSVDGD